MKNWLSIPLVLVLSAATAALTARVATPAQAREGDTGSLALRADLARLSARVDELLEEQARLSGAVTAAAESTAAAPERSAVGGVEEAVARWMEENAARLLAGAGLAAAGDEPGLAADPRDLSKEPLQAIIAHLTGLDSIAWGDDDYWQRLRDSGRIEEVVAEFERMAERDPANADLKVALGGAYLQQLFGVGNSPAAGTLAMKADQAFDEALELDDEHWEARFSKAVSLSNWPAFLGKTGEAIHQFEVLIGQQEQGTASPEHAQSYLFLGNLYQQTGETSKALEAWKQGLGRFPEHDELRRQVELASR